MVSWNATYFVASTLPSNGVTGVTANLMLFVPKWEGLEIAPNDAVCFVGSASGLDTDVQSAFGGDGTNCTEKNGCGIHVHAGTSCDSKDLQGSHWYNRDVLDVDPWALIGYKQTNEAGLGKFASCVYTGFDVASNPDLLDGLPLLVHLENGDRASCGIISKAPADYVPPLTYRSHSIPIPGTTPEDTKTNPTNARVEIISGMEESVADGVCFMGYAMGLEPNIESFSLGTGSEQCTEKNGCGAHMHEGPCCLDKSAQGSHYYDRSEIPLDPWARESYLTTDSMGDAALIGCAITGRDAIDYKNRLFILHDSIGDRILCGTIEGSGDSDGAVDICANYEGDSSSSSDSSSKNNDAQGSESGSDSSSEDGDAKETESSSDSSSEDGDSKEIASSSDSSSEDGDAKETESSSDSSNEDGDAKETESKSCTTGKETKEMSLHDIACSHCEDVYVPYGLSKYCTMCSLFKKCDPDHALSSGAYTAFFPTDEAFEGSAATVSSLSEKELCNVFSFHFHEGKAVNIDNLVCKGTLEMLNGKDSRTKCEGGEIYQKGFGNIKAGTLPKILAEHSWTGCNGEIITIDQIMIP